MLTKTLLLHILIVLSPMFIYSFFLENRPIGRSRVLIGIMQGMAGILCMLLPFVNYDFRWDLRYIPLVMSFLYGGRMSGAITLVMLLVVRFLEGGTVVTYGIIITISVTLLPLIFAKNFYQYLPKKRIFLGVLVTIWSVFCAACIVLFYVFITKSCKTHFPLLTDLLSISAVQTIGMLISIFVHERIIERIAMRKEIEHAEKMNTLGELAASIAHEIRNPLTVVKGFLQLMKQGQNYQYVPLILSEVERAEMIINDYLNFAKPQFRKTEKCSLHTVILDVLALLEPLAMNNQLQFKTQLQDHVYVETDRDQLKQALINIIKNAIEATTEGSITVRMRTQHKKVYITITDTGKGMTKEQLTRIGTLFYTTKDKGTGLGTLVSLRIIEAMDGKVSYTSELGVGTEASIILPCKE